MPDPDLKLRLFYEAECDCGRFHVDGNVRATVMGKLAKHRETCRARQRFHRTRTLVWRGEGERE